MRIKIVMFLILGISAAGVCFAQSEDSSEDRGSSSASAKGSLPAVPPGVRINAGNRQVTLSWRAVTGATSYTIKRGTSSGSYDDTFTTTATQYIDTDITSGPTYYYVIEAVNDAGTSADSNEISATQTFL